MHTTSLLSFSCPHFFTITRIFLWLVWRLDCSLSARLGCGGIAGAACVDPVQAGPQRQTGWSMPKSAAPQAPQPCAVLYYRSVPCNSGSTVLSTPVYPQFAHSPALGGGGAYFGCWSAAISLAARCGTRWMSQRDSGSAAPPAHEGSLLPPSAH